MFIIIIRKKMKLPVETGMMGDNEMSDEVTPCTVWTGQVEQLWEQVL